MKMKHIVGMLSLLGLIFISGGGFGKCGPTSPGRTCAQWVSDQTGTVCRPSDIGTLCTPVVTKTCARWSC